MQIIPSIVGRNLSLNNVNIHKYNRIKLILHLQACIVKGEVHINTQQGENNIMYKEKKNHQQHTRAKTSF